MANDKRLIDLTLDIETSRFSTRSFSDVLILGVTNKLKEKITSISSSAELPDDTEIKEAAGVAFSQSSPLGYVYVTKVTPTKTVLNTIEGATSYSVVINGQEASGTKTSDLKTGITAAIGDSDVTVTTTDSAITIADPKAKGFILGDVEGFTVTETAESATDALEAAVASGNDFFGIAIGAKDKTALVPSCEKFAEENKRLFFISDNKKDSTIFSKAKEAGLSYTSTWYGHSDYLDIAAMAKGFSYGIGSCNFANMTLSVVETDALTESEYNALTKNNVNTYETIHNVNLTQNGVVASGEYIDIIRDSCSLYDELMTNLLGVLVNNKIPYTDDGIMTITEAIAKTLDKYVDNGFISKTETNGDGTTNKSYTIQAPRASSIPQNEKATRKLKGVKFQARIAGAVNHISMVGTISYSNIDSGSVSLDMALA